MHEMHLGPLRDFGAQPEETGAWATSRRLMKPLHNLLAELWHALLTRESNVGGRSLRGDVISCHTSKSLRFLTLVRRR